MSTTRFRCRRLHSFSLTDGAQFCGAHVECPQLHKHGELSECSKLWDLNVGEPCTIGAPRGEEPEDEEGMERALRKNCLVRVMGK